MAPPTKLAIATSSVQRLLKEESSYHAEQEAQLSRIQKLEGESGSESAGENREFMLKQERQSLEETKAVFGPLKKRIADAVAGLEAQLTQDQATAPTEEVEKAKGVLNEAKASAL